MTTPVELPASYRPYRWAPPLSELAARHGLRAEQIIRFDQNVPPLPGVPQVPVGRSFASLNDYGDGTYRELKEAAASYAGVGPEQIVVGAGADDLILLIARVFLGPGRAGSAPALTYPLYRIATGLAGAELVAPEEEADLVWVCNPENPTGELRPPESLPGLGPLVVVDEAYWEFAGATAVPLGADNVIAIRTMSKAFALAALRVGYAVCPPAIAAELEARRAPAPIAEPAARIAAAALREPRLDVASVVAERDRMSAALREAGYELTDSRGSFVYVLSERGDELEARGLVPRQFPTGFRVTVRLPAENDLVLEALGCAPAGTRPGRTAVVSRITTETALRVSLDLDGQGRARAATGIGLLDHLLAALAFHGGFDLEIVAGGDLEVDEHHTSEDVLAALGDALGQALGSRDGIARYGSADVPMDEALARCTIDLVQRPHAEVRVPGLYGHAFERFAMQARLTLHLEADGQDAHHVAEAAFKALGRALRAAAAPGASGSTKGAM
jgi:histidinol-phosphate/aromatic aminotransferase/cobyric acid decarboxylase-like protein/imidazoleglycerol phosphate dehydratase HisB